MLKDLEKRRSRDLETSPSLNENITWESGPSKKSFNWLSFLIVCTLFLLLVVIGYLIWDRTLQKTAALEITKKADIVKPQIKTIQINKSKTTIVEKQPSQKKIKALIVEKDVQKHTDTDDSVDRDEADDAPVIILKKIHRPLNSKQLAEIAYKKGFEFLQQGRMHQGKESLRKALSLYLPHIKAREMLAGIFIKSGRLINAAEL